MRWDGELWSPDTLMLPLTTFSKFFLNLFLSGINPVPIPWSRYLSKLSIVITGLSTWNGWVFLIITICYDHNGLPHWSRWVGLLTIPQTQASTLPSASHSSPPSPSASCQTSPRCHQMEVRHHQLSSPLSNYSSHSPTVLFHPIFFWEILISLDSIGIWMMYPRIEVPCVAQRNLEELEKRDQAWTKKCHFCETCAWNGASLKSVLCHRLESWKRKGKFGLPCDSFEKQHLWGNCHGWLHCGNSSLYQD